jgi:imidazolonepropionase-like amidohydrolase
MKRITWRLGVALALAVVGAAVFAEEAAKDQAAPAKAKAGKTALVIQGGDIYPVRGPVIRGGSILVEDGRISALGARVDVPEGATVINATGKVVMPGLVAARLDGLVPGSAKKIADALDPYHAVVAFALASGVTAAYVQAGSPGESGMSTVNAVVKMTEGDLKGMLLREPVAVNLVYTGRSAAQRGVLRLTLQQAASYLRRQAQYERDKAAGLKVEEPPKAPPGTEEALKLLRRELPARVSAAGANEVMGAVALATEFGFRLVLEDMVEGWTVAPEIARCGAEAVVQPRIQAAPDRALNAPTGSSDTQPAVLSRAGVRLAIVPEAASFSTGGDFGEDLFMLPLEAAYAVGGGLDEQVALEAITINPAEMLGVGDRIGSLQVGKDADLIILDGHPLHYRAFVECTVVNGKVVYEKAKSTLFSHVGAEAKTGSGGK